MENRKPTKLLIVAFLLGILLLGAYWIYKETTKPLPGGIVEDMGAEHITDISGISYNSNPPTSGPHFAVWAKRGIYDRVISDGHLIHSLEHGYIVVSYNCSKPFALTKNLVPVVSAQELEDLEGNPTSSPTATLSGEPLTKLKVFPQGQMSWITPETAPGEEISLPEEFKSDQCKDLVSKLSALLDDYQRLIIVPKVNLDTPIATTAWGRIDKMEIYDEARIRNFISSYHNKGPEKTVE